MKILHILDMWEKCLIILDIVSTSLREWRHNIIYSLQVSLLRFPRNVFTFYVVRDLRGESNYEMKPRNVFSFHASIFPVMRPLPPATGTGGQITPSPSPPPRPAPASALISRNGRRSPRRDRRSYKRGLRPIWQGMSIAAPEDFGLFNTVTTRPSLNF